MNDAIKTRKPRTNDNYYVAVLLEGDPILIRANTQADALNAVVQLRVAKPADLLTAGRAEYRQIDATAMKLPS